MTPLRKLLLLTAIASATAQSQSIPAPTPAAAPAPALTPSTSQDRRLLDPAVHDMTLSPGDLITVRIYGQSDYAPSVRIGADGTVLLPLIGTVELQGLTIPEATHRIAERLSAAGMYRDPQVTLQITEGLGASVTIVGEVHGIVPIIGSRRLLDVLAASGGLPPTASHIVTIRRPGVAQPIVVDLGADLLHSELGNTLLFPGDTIIVSPIGIVYMVGEFKRTGVLPLTANKPLTLIQATALSDGFLFDAKYDDTRIIRTVGDRRTVMKVNVRDVLYGKAPDPILQPGDIVFLPNSALKTAFNNGTFSTALSITSLILALTLR
jgi:polysaccharide export outer membrane protein